jgi:hypothetical protein
MFGAIEVEWSTAWSFQAIELGGNRGVANGADVDLDCLLVPSPIQPPPRLSTQGDVYSLNADVPRRA